MSEVKEKIKITNKHSAEWYQDMKAKAADAGMPVNAFIEQATAQAGIVTTLEVTDGLPEELTIEAATERIKIRIKRTSEDIVLIGRDLLLIKTELKHGEFGDYLQEHFEMSQQSANNFMNVAARFGDNSQLLGMSSTVLYELAAPSTPDEVIAEVAAKVSKGESVKVADVKEMKAKAKPAKEPAKVSPPKADPIKAKSGIPVDEPPPLAPFQPAQTIQDEGDPNASKRRAVQAVYDGLNRGMDLMGEHQTLLTKDHFVGSDAACQDMIKQMAAAMRLWANVLSPEAAPVGGNGKAIRMVPELVTNG